MVNNKGFTLIELLVVITIIILFAGGGIAYYNSFTTSQQLQTEQKKLVDVLELAKQKANTADVGDGACNNFTGYKVAATSSTTYELQLCCDNSCNKIQSYTTNNVTTDLTSVQFKPLSYGTTSNDQPIILQNSSGNTTICVRQSGLIEEQSCN